MNIDLESLQQRKSIMKKRKRTIVSRSPPEIDINKAWAAEEEEVERRDAEKDAQLLKQSCDEIRRLMKEMLVLKKTKNAEAEVTEKRIQASLLFVTMKKLNRMEKFRSKKARDATQETKQKVDTYHLQLQNLLYEVTHLQKEVNKCHEFKSKDEEIQLVPVEEFYREAPAHISKPEITKNDPHQLALARLDWELEQRKQLTAKCTEAEATKDIISQQIKLKLEYLDNLAPRLHAILEATLPVQQYLGMPEEVKRTQNKMARFLPSPLFILYVQASAYAEASNNNFVVTIEGDLDEAKALKESTEEKDIDSGDSDQEDFGGEKRHRRPTTDRMTETRRKVLEKHPLNVLITFKCKDDHSLQIRFFYIVALKIVTLKTKFTAGTALQTASLSNDFLSPELLLSCLFPGDDGQDTPNPTNHYQLHRLGMAAFRDYIAELGIPYLWAQRVAGLEFVQQSSDRNGSESNDGGQLSSDPTVGDLKPTVSISATHMENTMKAIKRRLISRIALQQQLSALERGSVSVPPESSKMFPAKISATLVSWRPMAWDDFKAIPFVVPYTEDLISDKYYVFEAFIEKGSAKLTTYVVLSPSYPSQFPIFILSMRWKSLSLTSLLDDGLREIEREVNVYCDELTGSGQTCNYVLVNQVQRLLMCFDVYLEAEAADSSVEGPAEFPKEKVFFRQFRGRNRSKPYRYIPTLGLFIQR